MRFLGQIWVVVNFISIRILQQIPSVAKSTFSCNAMVSRYQENRGDSHYTVVKNIIKYLKRMNDMLLVYGGKEELRVIGYTDASFQTNKDNSFS